MEKIKVIWTCTTDIICVPSLIAQNLDEYTDDFLEWVSGTSFDPAIKSGTSFSIEHYVYYLNDRYLSDNLEKVYVVCENYEPVTKQEISDFRKMRKIHY